MCVCVERERERGKVRHLTTVAVVLTKKHRNNEVCVVGEISHVFVVREKVTQRQRKSRANQSEEKKAEVRFEDAEQHKQGRANQSEEKKAEVRLRDAEQHEDARSAARAQGPFTKSMPADMPSDAVLGQFEQNVSSAQGLFWARTGNYLFEDFRNMDFANMDAATATLLKEAISQEAEVTPDDIKRCMEDYTHRMNPTLCPVACGSCGRADIPMEYDPNGPDAKLLGIETFHEVLLSDPILYPLHLTVDETTAFERPVPSHVLDTPENRARWLRFRPCLSIVSLPSSSAPPSSEAVFAIPSLPLVPVTRIHLYPQLCTELSTNLCGTCFSDLTLGNIPFICAASGWDLGSPERAEPPLPELSFVTKLMIARSRVLSSALHIRIPRFAGSYGSFKGHCICFPDQAADVCAHLMPSAAYAGREVVVTVEGPQGGLRSRHLEGALRQLGILRGTADDAVDWLWASYFLNPIFANISVLEREEAKVQMDLLINTLIGNKVLLPWANSKAEQDAAMARADVTAPDANAPLGPSRNEPDDIVHLLEPSSELEADVTLLLSRQELNTPDSATSQTLQAVFNMAFKKGSGERSDARNAVPVQEAMSPILASAALSDSNEADIKRVRDPCVSLPRGTEPLSDYEQRNGIIYGAFPTIFLLGQGCGPGNGPLSREVRMFLLKHFSRRPATNQQFLAYLHNVKIRSDTGAVAAASIRTDPKPLTKFLDTIMQPGMESMLSTGIQNPRGPVAQRLIGELAPLIQLQGAKVPFSPFERGTRGSAELFAMFRYYGANNVYITVAPDMANSCIVARLACGFMPNLSASAHAASDSASAFWNQTEHHAGNLDLNVLSGTLPPPLLPNPPGSIGAEPVEIWRQEISLAITRDPAAVALLCQRMMEAVNEAMLGVPRSQKRTKVDFSRRVRGIVGRLRAWFHVSEVTGRKKLHWHGVYWTFLPLWLSQRCAGARHDLGVYISQMLATAFNAHASARLHGVHLMRRMQKQELKAAHFCPPPSETGARQVWNWGCAVSVALSVHRHCPTCHVGPRGPTECRLSYRRPTVTCTAPRMLKTRRVKEGKKFNVYPTHAEPDQPPSLPIEESSNNSDHDDHLLGTEVHDLLRRLALPGGDTRFLEYPLKRPVLTIVDIPQDVLLRQYARLAEACARLHLQPLPMPANPSYADVVGVVSQMMVRCGLGDLDHAVLDPVEDADVYQALDNLPREQRLDFVDYFMQQNDLLSETLPVLSAALGCAVNAQALVSAESSMNTLFYLVGYLLKDTMAPADVLGFIQAARARFETYPGRAPEGKDPQADFRPARRLMQIVQNGVSGSAEISIQQMVLNIAGYPSHDSSDNFSFVFKSAALREFRKALASAHGEDAGAAIEDSVNSALAAPSLKRPRVNNAGPASQDSLNSALAAPSLKRPRANDAGPIQLEVEEEEEEEGGAAGGGASEDSLNSALAASSLKRPRVNDAAPSLKRPVLVSPISAQDEDELFGLMLDFSDAAKIDELIAGNVLTTPPVFVGTASNVVPRLSLTTPAFVVGTASNVVPQLSLADFQGLEEKLNSNLRPAEEYDPHAPDHQAAFEEAVELPLNEGADPSAEIDSLEFDPYALIDEASELPAPAVGRVYRTSKGDLSVTSQDIEYKFRGFLLAFISLTEFACFMRKIPIPKPKSGRASVSAAASASESASDMSEAESAASNPGSEDDTVCESDCETPRAKGGRSGRKANAVFLFDPAYAFADISQLRLASKQTIPVYGGLNSVPRWPPLDLSANEGGVTEECEVQMTAFAEWVIAMLLPWPAPGHMYPELVQDPNPVLFLTVVLAQLTTGSFLRNVDGSYVGPPGFAEASIPAGSQDAQTYAFSQRCLARFIASLARGFPRSNTRRKIQAIWRGRTVQAWGGCEDSEKLLFPTEYAEAHITDGFMQGNESGKVGGPSAADIAAFAVDLQRQVTLAEQRELEGVNEDSASRAYLGDMKSKYGVLLSDLDEVVQVPIQANTDPSFPQLGVFRATPSEIANVGEVLALDPQRAEPTPSLEPSLSLDSKAGGGLEGAIAIGPAMRIFNDMSRLTPGQAVVLREVAEFCDATAAGIQTSPLRMLVHGKAGSGKSFIVETVERFVKSMTEYAFCPTALTGQACTAINTTLSPCRTTQGMFKLGINPDRLKELDAKALSLFRKRLFQGRSRVALIWIDEISFMNPWILAWVHIRLVQVMECQDDFGGVSVILSGDFHQLPPVAADSFAERCFSRAMTETDSLGMRLFKSFRLRSLPEQVRCVDPTHAEFCENFRKGITTGLTAYFQQHILNPADRKAYSYVQLISPGNPERIYLTPLILSEWAKGRGDRVVMWKLAATFRGTAMSVTDTLAGLGSRHQDLGSFAAGLNPEIMGSFVAGAPIFLRWHLKHNPIRGLANGSRANLYALEWSTESIREEALAFLAENPTGNVVLPKGLEPSAILVRPSLGKSFQANWEKEVTLVKDDIIVPVGFAPEQITLTTGTRSLVATVRVPKFDFAFVSTVHKCQGMTMLRALFSMLRRPRNPSREDYHAIYTMLTRITHGDNFRILADLDDLGFVEGLLPPVYLFAFEEGYDSAGVWDQARAEAALVRHKQTRASAQRTPTPRGKRGPQGRRGGHSTVTDRLPQSARGSRVGRASSSPSGRASSLPSTTTPRERGRSRARLTVVQNGPARGQDAGDSLGGWNRGRGATGRGSMNPPAGHARGKDAGGGRNRGRGATGRGLMNPPAPRFNATCSWLYNPLLFAAAGLQHAGMNYVKELVPQTVLDSLIASLAEHKVVSADIIRRYCGQGYYIPANIQNALLSNLDLPHRTQSMLGQIPAIARLPALADNQVAAAITQWIDGYDADGGQAASDDGWSEAHMFKAIGNSIGDQKELDLHQAALDAYARQAGLHSYDAPLVTHGGSCGFDSVCLLLAREYSRDDFMAIRPACSLGLRYAVCDFLRGNGKVQMPDEHGNPSGVTFSQIPRSLHEDFEMFLTALQHTITFLDGTAPHALAVILDRPLHVVTSTLSGVRDLAWGRYHPNTAAGRANPPLVLAHRDTRVGQHFYAFSLWISHNSSRALELQRLKRRQSITGGARSFVLRAVGRCSLLRSSLPRHLLTAPRLQDPAMPHQTRLLCVLQAHAPMIHAGGSHR